MKATARAQLISARTSIAASPFLHHLVPPLSAPAGGATTCRLGTYGLPHSDPLTPQGGAGLPRLVGGSSGCPPGGLCSGELAVKQWESRTRLPALSHRTPMCDCLFSPLSDLSLFIFPRCSPASWIPSCSYVLCLPVTWALLTWLPTWSTPCMS